VYVQRQLLFLVMRKGLRWTHTVRITASGTTYIITATERQLRDIL